MAEDRMLSDEILLGLIKKNGGGGGTTNYNLLENKPQIAGTELQGNKTLADLGIASAQSVSNITNGESINNFAGVETALGNKQGKLTAGNHIEISNNEVSVNRYAIPAGDIVYKVITGNYSSGEICYVDKYKTDGSFIERITVNPALYGTQDVDGYIRFKKEWNRWEISLLVASKEQSAGYQYAVNPKTTETENSFTFSMPRVEDNNDLIIRSELATKADTDMVAADFNAGTSYTVGNYCVQDGKLYKFKNNHSGAWSSADVDEVKITGELSALRSGLTNLNSLNNLYLSFPATDMQEYLSKAIDYADSNFNVGLTINAIGIWQGTCTFLLQVCRASSTQTIISAIPQPNNYVNKMWIGMKENDVYSYSTIDMAVVN